MFGKEIFDFSEAKAKTMVEPQSSPNDVGRKAASKIVAGIIHADIVEKFRQVDKTSPIAIVKKEIGKFANRVGL